MKKLLACVVTLAVLAALDNVAQARPGYAPGESCNECHFGNHKTVKDAGHLIDAAGNPTSAFSVEQGDSVDIGIRVTDGADNYGIGLVGLDAATSANLDVTQNSGWFPYGAAGFTSIAPFGDQKQFVAAPEDSTLNLTVAATTPAGSYPLSMIIAGDGVWSDVNSFMLNVTEPIPEPSSLVLLGLGLGGLGLASRRRRRSGSR